MADKETRYAPISLGQRVKSLPAANMTMLEQNAEFRFHLLSLIRLAGSYARTVFLSTFPPAAKRRHAIMSGLAQCFKGKLNADSIAKARAEKRPNPESCISYWDIFSEDIVNKDHICFMRDCLIARGLSKQDKKHGREQTIEQLFSASLQSRYGLPLTMAEFIDALTGLQKKRNFLEHYPETPKNREDRRKIRKQIADNSGFLYNLGLLLLPRFGNELAQFAYSLELENTAAQQTAKSIETIFNIAKKDSNKAVDYMFAVARSRSFLGQKYGKLNKKGGYKNKKIHDRKFKTARWRHYYAALKLSPTDYRQETFKKTYEFIGDNNFRALYALCGARFLKKSLPNSDAKKPASIAYIYESEQPRPSFKYEIEPLYFTIMDMQKIMEYYLRKASKDASHKIIDPISRGLRNTIAHNRLFWQMNMPQSLGEQDKFFSPERLFHSLMAVLPNAHERKLFYKTLKIALYKENRADFLAQQQQQGNAPTRFKDNYFSKKRQQALQKKHKNIKRDERPFLRRQLEIWIKNLEDSYKKACNFC